MKTTLEQKENGVGYTPKESVLHLKKIHSITSEEEFLGEATFDLSEYSECSKRSLYSVDLKKSPFTEARIEFYIMATPLAGRSRTNSIISNERKGLGRTGSLKISRRFSSPERAEKGNHKRSDSTLILGRDALPERSNAHNSQLLKKFEKDKIKEITILEDN